MLLIFQSRVHQQPQDFDLAFGLHRLSLDIERLLVHFASLGYEMYNGCFVCFKSRSAPFLPVKCFIDVCCDTFPVALHGWPSHPRGEIIHKSNCSFLAVDRSLHEICVEEEKEDRGLGRALRQSSLWQALNLR
ncbi:hypothetical protein VI817_000217 [Penicillium citrinum]|nr:hypothetical protein VI817_000217 [Penicillium citrinum]